MLVFSTDLSAADRASVESYLTGKYILAVPEPATLVIFALGGLLVLRRK